MIGAKKLRERIEPRQSEIIEDLKQVVSIDSPTFPGEGPQKSPHTSRRATGIWAAMWIAYQALTEWATT
jgi:hypothetical protein